MKIFSFLRDYSIYRQTLTEYSDVFTGTTDPSHDIPYISLLKFPSQSQVEIHKKPLHLNIIPEALSSTLSQLHISLPLIFMQFIGNNS